VAPPMSSPMLELRLLPPDAPLPDGRALKAVEPTAACVVPDDEALVVALRLPEASLSEQRWCVDQLARKLRSAYALETARVSPHEAVSDDVALAVALDQHLATRGKATLAGRPGLAERRGALGAALDLYAGWVDEDATTRTSLAIVQDVMDWASERGDVDVEILDHSGLEEQGLRLLLAVGEASTLSPPRLIVARYRAEDPRPPRMLIGKGVTFDSGGINVKPYESFVSMMKNDMAGAALAWTSFKAMVESGVDEPLVLVIPTCENPIGEGAMRPGTVVRSYAGHTVRIDHTDAEGRLILADALAYASARHAPREVLCFATLTTAALIAYGPLATPVHFADPALEARLRAASEAVGEDLHFFPARLWHREANRDQEADLRNTARLPGHANRSAGSRNAAHFLRFFTEAPLVHFDIFASAWNWGGDAPGAGPGATGAPLRSLLRAELGW
jgi:leucyl aminopeptidase